MIRFLQTGGKTTKYILGGLLLIICASMVITLIPGGLGSDVFGAPGKGVIAKVDGVDISTEEVQLTADQIAREQASRYGEMAQRIMPLLRQQATQRAVEQLPLSSVVGGETAEDSDGFVQPVLADFEHGY